MLKSIACCFNVDLAYLRRNYGRYLACSQNVPLVFSPFLVLVPFKMRRPEYENDGATGYVNLIDVTGVTAAEAGAGQDLTRCRVHLKGEHSVPSLFSAKNTSQRLNTGRLAFDRFCALQNSGRATDPLPVVKEGFYNQDNSSKFLGELIRLILKVDFRE